MKYTICFLLVFFLGEVVVGQSLSKEDSVIQMITLADEYRADGEYEQAERLLKNALKLSEAPDYDSLLAQIYFHLGLVYDYSNEPQLALDCHHRSLELREQSNANESLIAESYQAIGDVYYLC